MTTDEEIAAWDAEAPEFDLPADHGLRDPRIRDAWRALLLAHLPMPPARVADLGCGTGTLSLLLGQSGFAVDGLDFSPAMIELATSKADALGPGVPGRVSFQVADAFDPPLEAASYDVVLCRHVLWAMPDPAEAVSRWTRLLGPGGRLVLIEGRWSNGAGLSAEESLELVGGLGRSASLTRLPEAAYWGRSIEDDRYVVVSPALV